MSLLQDALRKAQKGYGGAAKQAGPPLPGAGGSAPSRSPWFWGGLALAAVFLLGAVVVTVLVRTEEESPQRAPQPAAPVSAPAVPVAPAPPHAVSVPATGGPGGDARLSAPEAVRPTGPAAATAPPRAHARPAAKAQAGGVPVPLPAPGTPPLLSAPLSMAAPQPMPAASTGGKVSQLARFNEGVAAQKKGDWEAAARLFREVVSKEPSIVEGWSGLGNALLRLGKLPEADSALRKALSLDPNYPAALMNAGFLRLQDGRAAEAEACFARAMSLDPRNPAPRVNLAIAQARRGALAEAEETLTVARRAFPSNAEIHYHLGTVHERTGDRDKAREAYSSFLEVSGGRRPDLERLVRERLKEM